MYLYAITEYEYYINTDLWTVSKIEEDIKLSLQAFL